MEIWWSEEDQAFLAEVYDLPGCMADGKTEAAAMKAAHESARLWIEVAVVVVDLVWRLWSARRAFYATVSTSNVRRGDAWQ